jgi:hypothetical protein
MWWTIVFMCLAYFGADIAVQFVPPPVATQIAAWRDETTLNASCRLAFLTSHADPVTTELG